MAVLAHRQTHHSSFRLHPDRFLRLDVLGFNMPHAICKLAFGACAIDDVTRFAEPYGFRLRADRPETAEHDEEQVWRTDDGENKLHRIINSFLGVIYLMFDGADAEVLAQAAKHQLDGWTLDEVIERLDGPEGTGTWTIGALGILAPRSYHAGVFVRFERLLRHETAGVRLAALHSSADPSQYREWTAPLIALWTTVAENDVDERVRKLAALGIDGARNFTPL
jgi:hypothetical protein